MQLSQAQARWVYLVTRTLQAHQQAAVRQVPPAALAYRAVPVSGSTLNTPTLCRYSKESLCHAADSYCASGVGSICQLALVLIPFPPFLLFMSAGGAGLSLVPSQRRSYVPYFHNSSPPAPRPNAHPRASRNCIFSPTLVCQSSSIRQLGMVYDKYWDRCYHDGGPEVASEIVNGMSMG